MTLTSADLQVVTRLTQDMIREAFRSASRGESGLTLPTPVARLGTVGGVIHPGAAGDVRIDGDSTAITITNGTGQTLGLGSRVEVTFTPPHGVLITGIVSKGSWDAYTPTWTASSSNPSIGNGSIYGRFTLLANKRCAFRIGVAMGSTSSGGTGSWSWSLPYTAHATGEQWGVAKMYVSALSQSFLGECLIGASATTCQVYTPRDDTHSAASATACRNADASAAAGTGIPTVAGSYPLTNGSNLYIQGEYEIA